MSHVAKLGIIASDLLLGACTGEAAGTGTTSTGEVVSTGEVASTGSAGSEASTDAPTTGEPEPLPGACAVPIAPVSRSNAHLHSDQLLPCLPLTPRKT